MNKLNNKGFTLVELLAVIVIISILMIVAIPAITTAIANSRKEAYLDEVRMQKNSIEEVIAQNQYYIYDKDTVYYFDYKLGNEDKNAKSPYGEWREAYVVVTFDGKRNQYYWTGIDSAGNTIELNKKVDNIRKGDIKNVTSKKIDKTKKIAGKTKVKIYSSDD